MKTTGQPLLARSLVALTLGGVDEGEKSIVQAALDGSDWDENAREFWSAEADGRNEL